MKTAARLLLLALVVFTICAVPVAWWTTTASWMSAEANDFWPDFPRRFPELYRWLTNPIVPLACLTATWRMMVRGMSLGLEGKRRRLALALCKDLGFLAGMATLAGWLLQHPEHFDTALNLLPLATMAIVAWKIVDAGRAFVRLLRSGLATRREFQLFLIVWFIIAALILAAAALATEHESVPPSLVWLVAGCLFPAREIPACVLNLAKNRHR